MPSPTVRHPPAICPTNEWGKHRNFCISSGYGSSSGISLPLLFLFAGIWDGGKDAGGNWVKSCSILTTTPNAVTSAVHDRMPVILDPDSYDLWLDPGMQNAAISEMLKPYDARQMRCYPVSTRINHVANDMECCAPVELAQIQARLFS